MAEQNSFKKIKCSKFKGRQKNWHSVFIAWSQS